MTKVRVRGFQIFKQNDKWYCYHRKTKAAIDLDKFPLGSTEFFVETLRIAEAKTLIAAAPANGTLGRLICDYRAHASFTNLAEQTRADYQRVFDYLQPIDKTPLKSLKRSTIVKIRDRAAVTRKRRFANYVRAVLSVIFGWGLERDYVKENFASGIKDLRRPRGMPKANRPWSDTERHAVLEAAPKHMLPALGLMMMTGLGPKDALSLPKTAWSGGEIVTARAKTDHPVIWPVAKQLKTILRAAPKHDAITLCATSRGQPWTLSGFRASWGTLRKRLEMSGAVQPGLTVYGLRHTVAVILREAGLDERTIADALGQETIEMARHYAKGADLRPKMQGVVKHLDAELNKRRTKTVKKI